MLQTKDTWLKQWQFKLMFFTDYLKYFPELL